MNSLRDILVYLFRHYPYPKELSKARVVKMIYLADWRNAIQHGVQLTTIRWYFNHFGPYVDEVINVARQDEDFEVVLVTNCFHGPKELIKLKSKAKVKGELSLEAQMSLDHVIKNTSNLYWDDFISLVYSTYPIITQSKYSQLDLPKLAKEYRLLSGDVGVTEGGGV